MSNWMVYAHTTVLDLWRFVEVLSGAGTQEIIQTEQVETWIRQNTLKICSDYNFGEFVFRNWSRYHAEVFWCSAFCLEASKASKQK